MEKLIEIGKRAQAVTMYLASLGCTKKNEALCAVAKELTANTKDILTANDIDIKKARENGMKESLVDRLKLTEERIFSMAEGLRQVADLEDPVGEVLSMKQRPNGLLIGQKLSLIHISAFIF